MELALIRSTSSMGQLDSLIGVGSTERRGTERVSLACNVTVMLVPRS